MQERRLNCLQEDRGNPVPQLHMPSYFAHIVQQSSLCQTHFRVALLLKHAQDGQAMSLFCGGHTPEQINLGGVQVRSQRCVLNALTTKAQRSQELPDAIADAQDHAPSTSLDRNITNGSMKRHRRPRRKN